MGSRVPSGLIFNTSSNFKPDTIFAMEENSGCCFAAKTLHLCAISEVEPDTLLGP
jgi:hypothetical protein